MAASTPSGDVPTTAADGQVVPTAEMGVVLVLIPGGEFWMGAQSDRPGDPAFDPVYAAANQEAPAHRVALDPYFIAKYEMTRAQWRRLAMMTGGPSFPRASLEEELWSMAQIDWTTIHGGLGRVGLTLPTEAQWERAARGGSDQPWSFGDDPSRLHEYANYADLSRQGAEGVREGQFDPANDDGFPAQAPVGEFLANPFGLYDVHGNALEWCLDARVEYAVEPVDGTGLRVDDKPIQTRGLRGGSYAVLPLKTRSWFRNSGSPGSAAPNVGFRPARALDR